HADHTWMQSLQNLTYSFVSVAPPVMPLSYAHHTTGCLLLLLNGISLVVSVSTMVVFQPKHTCTQQKLPTRPAALRRSGSRPLLIPSIWLRYATTKTKLSKASSKGFKACSKCAK